MSATDRDMEILAWLVERDAEAVAHAHEQFLAATEPEAVADLGRTYQRVSRCLRSTLALKMKAQQGQADHTARTTILGRRDAFAREQQIETRTRQLQDAVERVTAAAVADPDEREERLTDFDMALDDWIEQPDFTAADLDEQVRRACRMVATWSTLTPSSIIDPEAPRARCAYAGFGRAAAGRSAPASDRAPAGGSLRC